MRTQLQVLQAQADALPEQQRLLDEVAAKIPDSAQLPELLRALTVAAADSDVEFVSLVPGSPVPATPAAAPAATADGTGSGTAAAPAPATAGALHVIPITINAVGGYHDLERYVSRLEDLPRALRVSNLVLAPGANPVAAAQEGNVDDGRTLVGVISGSVYLKAGGSAAGGTTPAAGSAAAPGAAGAPDVPTSDNGS